MDLYLVVFTGFYHGEEVWDWTVLEGSNKNKQPTINSMAVAVKHGFPMLRRTQVVNICKLGRKMTLIRLIKECWFFKTVDVLVPTMAILPNGSKVYSQILIEGIMKPEGEDYLTSLWTRVEKTATEEFTRVGYKDFKIAMLGIQYV